MHRYSTRQAAKKLGLPSTTLAQYIAAKKIATPKTTRIGKIHIRAWSEADIERVRKLLPKIANGRRTRYKKKGKPPTKKR